MIPYHGGPITPETCAYRAWKGRHAMVSWWRPDQITLAAGICQSFALDNGAYSAWRAGRRVDWTAYYAWTAEWLSHPACDWAIIPDVVDGTTQENDHLLDAWPHGHRGVPVWHLHEPVSRLAQLADSWPRVALGSTAQYDVRRPGAALSRLANALPAITGPNGRPTVKLHGLRMLNPLVTSRVPLSSADSTNVARNIGSDERWQGTYRPHTPETRTDVLVERVEAGDTPATLVATGALHLDQLALHFPEEEVDA